MPNPYMARDTEARLVSIAIRQKWSKSRVIKEALILLEEAITPTVSEEAYEHALLEREGKADTQNINLEVTATSHRLPRITDTKKDMIAEAMRKNKKVDGKRYYEGGKI